MKKSKCGTYYRWITWIGADAVEYSMMTQVYQIGIYCVINYGSQHEQWSDEPRSLAKGQKKMLADLDKNGFKYTLGSTITVCEVDGFWKEQE